MGSLRQDEKILDDDHCEEAFDQQCEQWVGDVKYVKVIEVPSGGAMVDKCDSESEDFLTRDATDIVAFCIHAIEILESG